MEDTERNMVVTFFFERLFAMFTYLTRILRGERGKAYGRKRSLIRRLGSVLPLQPLPRFYLGAKVRQSGMGDICFHDYFLEDDSGYVMSHGISYQQSQLGSGCYHGKIRSSTPIKVKECEKIMSLQEEVQSLRAMVHELWSCHQVALLSDCEEKDTVESCVIPPSVSASPAQLTPPPPPPLPLFPLSLTPVPIVRKKKSQTTDMHLTEHRGESVLSLGDILKDITKVKLRPVERSPGGNPIRRPLPPSEPSSVLAAVLKKRFAAMNCETPTSHYHDSVSEDDISKFDLDMFETGNPPVVLQLFA